jgi:hypothetical protein
LLVDETPHKTILDADELYSVCESLKSRRQAVGCFVNLKRLGSALVAQKFRPADINDIFGCKWQQQRLLRPLRRSAVAVRDRKPNLKAQPTFEIITIIFHSERASMFACFVARRNSGKLSYDHFRHI